MTITQAEEIFIMSYFAFLLDLNGVQRCRHPFWRRFKKLIEAKGFKIRKVYCMNWLNRAKARKRMRDNHEILKEVRDRQEEYGMQES